MLGNRILSISRHLLRASSPVFRCTAAAAAATVMPTRCFANKKGKDYSESLSLHLGKLKTRYNELNDSLASGMLNPKELQKQGREFAHLARIMEQADERAALRDSIEELKVFEQEEGEKGGADGNEFAEVARVEREEHEVTLSEIETSILDLLIAQDEADERGIIVEVRAGTGGDEASLFASEVFKMYSKLCAYKGWKWDELSLSKSEIGGFKEAQASISGDSVYKLMKFESGVHRVQRIPVNDKVIQTSACSVIVMPEATDVDVVLRPQDLRIDVFRAGGAGGQSVNKTESAVRITHLPTGLKIEMQDERSQIQNRARAMKYLQARVYDYEREKVLKERQNLRSAAQGTGDRSDKIRTYNFPQDRVTDHRAGKTVTGVERVMNGTDGLDSILDALEKVDRQSKIEAFLDELN